MLQFDENQTTTPTILCVDDEPKVVDSLARVLSSFDVNIKKALHGMQGIWMAQVEKPDLIITDLQMPLADGQDLVEVARDVPIIVITGAKEPGTKRRLLDAGADAVLFKPVDTHRLLATIQKFVSLKDVFAPRLGAGQRDR